MKLDPMLDCLECDNVANYGLVCKKCGSLYISFYITIIILISGAVAVGYFCYRWDGQMRNIGGAVIPLVGWLALCTVSMIWARRSHRQALLDVIRQIHDA